MFVRNENEINAAVKTRRNQRSKPGTRYKETNK